MRPEAQDLVAGSQGSETEMERVPGLGTAPRVEVPGLSQVGGGSAPKPAPSPRPEPRGGGLPSVPETVRFGGARLRKERCSPRPTRSPERRKSGSRAAPRGQARQDAPGRASGPPPPAPAARRQVAAAPRARPGPFPPTRPGSRHRPSVPGVSVAPTPSPGPAGPQPRPAGPQRCAARALGAAGGEPTRQVPARPAANGGARPRPPARPRPAHARLHPARARPRRPRTPPRRLHPAPRPAPQPPRPRAPCAPARCPPARLARPRVLLHPHPRPAPRPRPAPPRPLPARIFPPGLPPHTPPRRRCSLSSTLVPSAPSLSGRPLSPGPGTAFPAPPAPLPKAKGPRGGGPGSPSSPSEPPWTPPGAPYLVGSTRGHLGSGKRLGGGRGTSGQQAQAWGAGRRAHRWKWPCLHEQVCGRGRSLPPPALG